jgi:hypothetical protein
LPPTTCCADHRITAAGCPDTSEFGLVAEPPAGTPAAAGPVEPPTGAEPSGIPATGEAKGPSAVAGPVGPPIGTAVVDGADPVTSKPTANALDCAPPVATTTPRCAGSAVTNDPIDGNAVVLVALAGDDTSDTGLNPPAGAALDRPPTPGNECPDVNAPILPMLDASEPAEAAAPADRAASADGAVPAGGADPSVGAEPGSVGSAHATPTPATAAPTPNANANAPTRPTCLA